MNVSSNVTTNSRAFLSRDPGSEYRATTTNVYDLKLNKITLPYFAFQIFKPSRV